MTGTFYLLIILVQKKSFGFPMVLVLNSSKARLHTKHDISAIIYLFFYVEDDFSWESFCKFNIFMLLILF